MIRASRAKRNSLLDNVRIKRRGSEVVRDLSHPASVPLRYQLYRIEALSTLKLHVALLHPEQHLTELHRLSVFGHDLRDHAARLGFDFIDSILKEAWP